MSPRRAVPAPLGSTVRVETRALPRDEELRVEIAPYRGKAYLSVRRWYRAEDGELRPGKGLTVEAGLIPFLRVAVAKAETEALRLGLLDEESFETAGLPLPAALRGAA